MAIGGGGAEITIVALIDLLPSATDFAVMVTLPPVGTAEGAVYVVCSWLPVLTGLKLPQELDPQVTDQLTPAADVSFVSCAVRAVMLPAETDAGGGLRKAIEIAAGVMLRVTELIAEGSLVTAALIVTVPPKGIAAGAL